MTKPLRQAVAVMSRVLPPYKRVLEIGSRQEKNQSRLANLRMLFPDSEYLGIDMRSGPGVDKVVDANKLPFANNSFDLVLCLETLEHADRPWLIAGEIQRVLAPKGIAIVSSQQNFPIHMHPSDYFRYTPYGLSILFPKLKDKLVFSISPPFGGEAKLNPQAVVVIGSKVKNQQLLGQIRRALIKNQEEISVHKPYRHRIQDCVRYFKRGIEELYYRQVVEFFKV
jgi:SAM-dependent methyltransferase